MCSRSAGRLALFLSLVFADYVHCAAFAVTTRLVFTDRCGLFKDANGARRAKHLGVCMQEDGMRKLIRVVGAVVLEDGLVFMAQRPFDKVRPLDLCAFVDTRFNRTEDVMCWYLP